LFTNPKEVFDQLKTRFLKKYSASIDFITSEQTNILKIFLIWIKEFSSDFRGNSSFRSEIESFIKTAIQTLPSATEQLSQLQDHFNKLIEDNQDNLITTQISSEHIQPSILPIFFGLHKFETFDISATELARQFTLWGWNLWRNCNLRELLYWNTKDQQKKSTSVIEFVEKL